jgi:hypothetical protein
MASILTAIVIIIGIGILFALISALGEAVLEAIAALIPFAVGCAVLYWLFS